MEVLLPLLAVALFVAVEIAATLLVPVLCLRIMCVRVLRLLCKGVAPHVCIRQNGTRLCGIEMPVVVGVQCVQLLRIEDRGLKTLGQNKKADRPTRG